MPPIQISNINTPTDAAFYEGWKKSLIMLLTEYNKYSASNWKD